LIVTERKTSNSLVFRLVVGKTKKGKRDLSSLALSVRSRDACVTVELKPIIQAPCNLYWKSEAVQHRNI